MSGARPFVIGWLTLLLLLGLSAASMLWAESRDSAWTEANRLALYAAIYAAGAVALAIAAVYGPIRAAAGEPADGRPLTGILRAIRSAPRSPASTPVR